MLFEEVVAFLGESLVQGPEVRANVRLDAHLVGEVLQFESELKVLFSILDVELDLLNFFFLLGRFQRLYLLVQVLAGLIVLLQRLFHVINFSRKRRIPLFIFRERVLQLSGLLLGFYILIAEL